MQPAAPPRPREQAGGHESAREDAGAPLRRYWLHLIFNDQKRTAKFKAPLCGVGNVISVFSWFGLWRVTTRQHLL